MKKTHIFGAVLCLAFWGVGMVFAQSAASGQSSLSSLQSIQSMAMPKIIWIYREEVRPARAAAHEKVEASYARLWKKAGVEPYLGLEAVSGDAGESLFISGYSSFAALEKDYKAFSAVSSGPLKNDYESLNAREGELISGEHSLIAAYRPDLSYLGENFMGNLPRSRYLRIETFHVRLGKDAGFAEGAKAYREAYKELHLEDPWVVYFVASGGPEGTYLVISSMNSLSDEDLQMVRHSKIEQAVNDKMGDMMKHADETISSIQTNIYRMNPKTSYVSDEFASVDPNFWRESPEVHALARADYSSDPTIIRKVQRALSNLGYSPGAVDGVTGKQTRSALRRYQKDHDMQATGVIDRDTADKLGI